MSYLPAKFNYVSIKKQTDHAIAKGNRLLVDTRYALKWFIYHDALPQLQWWEKGAQEYLALRGFVHRQW